MPTFADSLEELVESKQTVRIPAGEVEKLVQRFGDRVRKMGRWNVSGDGSLEIPVAVIHQAVGQIEGRILAEAIQGLKSEAVDTPAASALIDDIAAVYRRYLRDLMTRYQNTPRSDEAERLRDELVREVFGE